MSKALDPTDAVKERYAKADGLRAKQPRVIGLQVRPNWYMGGGKMWFEWDKGKGSDYFSVDCTTGAKTPLFDDAKLRKSLADAAGKAVPDGSYVSSVTMDEGGKWFEFQALGGYWRGNFADYALTRVPKPKPKVTPSEAWSQNLWPPDISPHASPDAQWTAQISGQDVDVENAAKNKIKVATGKADDYYARLEWSPDSKTIVANRVMPGDRKGYMYIQQSPPTGGPAKLYNRIYDRPGDKIDTFQMELINPDTKTVTPVVAPKLDYGDMPDIRWCKDKRHFTYEAMARGYSEWRVVQVDSVTGTSKVIIDDHPSTFVDSTSQFISYLSDDSMIWRSEKDGWGQLYFVQPDGTVRNRITDGKWVVREVVKVDEPRKRVVFAASGVHPGEDPYYIHYFAVGFDGKGMTELTPEPGDHQAILAPDGETLCDTYSTVQQAPVHNLRRVKDGGLICEIGKADDSALRQSGWILPEPFTAKGRDGKTDIYGVVYRPQDYSAEKKYPVIEDIYAGPQDSFVPKTYRPFYRNQALAEIGFIVVQIDGMGTRNRGKAFQDICYKNLKDAGLPDRIAWMKALALHDPAADISRVGVFGTSAGGQNAAGALLFHPEFYKVGVASCGCHDNRLDKLWWNEQWMGYPIGPEYAQCSNIDNAANLQGNLLLMVGEMDNNVPPESTFRFANALQKAGKDFDLVISHDADHGDGGPYGEHKRRDFFVRHLLGMEPPVWNFSKP